MRMRKSIGFAAALVSMLGATGNALAALTFELTTGDGAANTQSLFFDHNKCPAEGPLSAYIAGKLTNTGGSPVNNVQANIANLAGGFSLTGTQTATLNIGTLAAGAEIMTGWHITYPCTDAAANVVTISVSDSGGGSDIDVVTLTAREAKSANAGGNVLSTTLGAGAVVGQTITADVRYDFGNIDTGNEFVLQPAGNTDFDAACLQLVRTETTASNIAAIPVGVVNDLYFVSPFKQSGNGYFAEVRFYYRYLCAGVTSTARPYAGQTSGGTNLKYTGNYDGAGALVFDFPTSTNPFLITKTVSTNLLLAGGGPHVVTYTVTLENPSAFDTVIDGFSDVLPTGVSFGALDAASDVTVANSGSTPSNGDTGTVTFTGINGTSYAVPAASTISLIYTAAVQDVVGDYANSASGLVGAETIGPAATTVLVRAAELTVTKTVDSYTPGEFMIPGNDVVYTITVENTGPHTAQSNTLVLVDNMPPEIEFYNADFDGVAPDTGPFDFDPGTSSVVCCVTGEVDYSSSTSAPISYGYGPDPGYDGDVTYIKIEPKGALAPGESFTLRFRSRIE